MSSCPSARLAQRKSEAGQLGLPNERLNLALELDRHGFALAVPGRSSRHTDPALAHTILLDIGFLDAVEAYADAFFEQLRVVEGAIRIGRQTIGQRFVGLCRRFHRL